MLNQLGHSISKEATIKNFVSHPWKTTSNLANETLGYLGIGTKVLAEKVGIPVYGLTNEKTSAAQTHMLQKKK
jgi:hypothetical protein